MSKVIPIRPIGGAYPFPKKMRAQSDYGAREYQEEKQDRDVIIVDSNKAYTDAIELIERGAAMMLSVAKYDGKKLSADNKAHLIRAMINVNNAMNINNGIPEA